LRLSSDGVEYALWEFTGAPEDAAPPQVDLGGGWADMEWVDTTGTTRRARILIAGPAAVAPSGAVRVSFGRTVPRVRLVDNPEVVVRDSDGFIETY